MGLAMMRLVLISSIVLPIVAADYWMQPGSRMGSSLPRPTGVLRQSCKPIPSSIDWPTLSDWQALNTSVSGHLLKPIPIGAVCHPDWPTFDTASCSSVAAQWGNTSFHASDPFSADYNDITCLPQSDSPCSAAGYPAYVIEAQSVADVQAGINFARRTRVRLVIKGTGHDVPGRSSGASSLSIYMHNLRGFEIDRDDATAKALGGIAAVKIHAGEQMRDVYGFAADHNVTIVGGSDPDVGVGGWFPAGGHSPISARYGMGVDQVLSMEVVTADGVFRHIDTEHEPDLFWALRGGGPGTFGVMISVTVKAYPPVSVTFYDFSYTTTANSDTYWSLATYFHTQLPRMSEAGIMGYYYIQPDTGTGGASAIGQVSGYLLAPSLSINETNAIMESLEANITAASWHDKVNVSKSVTLFANFEQFWHQTTPESAGFSLRFGSRLWGADALTGDPQKLEIALRSSTPSPQQLLGHLVAGPGTRQPMGGIAGGNNALLPAWREAYAHVVAPRSWASLDQAAMLNVTADIRDNINPALASVAPHTGAYMNEADATQSDWQTTFFGIHYPRLLAVKQRWDPTGVFWCKHCVGSEFWDPIGPYGLENGVGQTAVQLCRGNTSFWRPHSV